MKKSFLIPILTLLASASIGQAANIVIDYQSGISSIGNGGLFSDPAGTTIGAATAVNGAAVSTNTNGRALAGSGSNPATDVTILSTITDNIGVSIDGFTSYRWLYAGGNNAFGFLEGNAARLSPLATSDGDAFSNSSGFVLVSDNYPVSGAVGDMINFSLQAGSDNGTTEIRTFLVFDGTTSVEIGSGTSVSGNSAPRITGSHTATAGFSQVGIYITARATSNLASPTSTAGRDRSLLNDIYLEVEPIPEPSGVLLIGLAGSALMLRRKRR